MGLRQGDLKDLVYHIFEIDSYASKMGDDKNIVTLSFTVNDKAPADDLVKFLEGGYSFILDSDVTAGEQRDGAYRVFVEIERDKSSNENIMEIVDGVSKLSNIDDFKFRYYKGFKSIECTIENLDKEVPLDPNNYGLTVSEGNLNNYKNFFSNSYVDEIVMEDNVLTIKKSYVDDLKFNVVDFGDTFTTVKRINESMDVMSSYPEILFLTKCLGDYNICKYGDKFAFENSESTLVLERIL
mgnify:FL=1|jgi:hypothetical protein|tara:strand:- start:71 stop:790 length:720 start_codon:yes stop_codon:yes gene_type:complete